MIVETKEEKNQIALEHWRRRLAAARSAERRRRHECTTLKKKHSQQLTHNERRERQRRRRSDDARQRHATNRQVARYPAATCFDIFTNTGTIFASTCTGATAAPSAHVANALLASTHPEPPKKKHNSQADERFCTEIKQPPTAATSGHAKRKKWKSGALSRL